MGISVFWDNDDHSIICQSFVGTWTWAEYDITISQIFEMIRAENHTVHIIADIRHSAPQLNGPAWKSYTRALRNMPTNTGLLVACGKGYFTTTFFLQLAQTFYRAAARTRHVQTLEEAYQLIKTAPAIDDQDRG
ncbi:MAG: hypothetical protein KF726_00155 [Anaerolineae bacterium]|nr:hypothetical protein [Anaerolineae bacterium]